MSYKTLLTEKKDGVMIIRLNRPEKLNAFTVEMLREIISALDDADADDAVRVVIFTGEGRGFCAGADLSAGADTFNYEAREDRADRHTPLLADGSFDYTNQKMRDGGGLVSLRVYSSLKPIIAAFNGPAVGVGITMMLPADIRLASRDARFGFVFTRRGIVMEACSSWFLPRLVGVAQAQEWVMTGRVFDAEEAWQGGLVRSLHEPEDLMPAAMALAQEIVENTSAVSVALCRRLLWSMMGVDHPMEAHKVDSRAIFSRGRSADVKEGVNSFLEKRLPQFPDKVSTDMPDFFPWEKKRKYE